MKWKYFVEGLRSLTFRLESDCEVFNNPYLKLDYQELEREFDIPHWVVVESHLVHSFVCKNLVITLTISSVYLPCDEDELPFTNPIIRDIDDSEYKMILLFEKRIKKFMKTIKEFKIQWKNTSYKMVTKHSTVYHSDDDLQYALRNLERTREQIQRVIRAFQNKRTTLPS